MNILAISGSLRAESSNTALVRATAALAPEGTTVSVYNGLGDLPHFSPERDGDTRPPSVRDLRERLRASNAVLICTPEYAHGIPGSLKNALDWLVSSGEFDGGKPAAALSASPSVSGGDKAHSSLVQTLRVLGARIPEGASLIVPLVRTKLDAQGNVTDPALAHALRGVLEALAQAVNAR